MQSINVVTVSAIALDRFVHLEVEGALS